MNLWQGSENGVRYFHCRKNDCESKAIHYMNQQKSECFFLSMVRREEL